MLQILATEAEECVNRSRIEHDDFFNINIFSVYQR